MEFSRVSFSIRDLTPLSFDLTTLQTIMDMQSETLRGGGRHNTQTQNIQNPKTSKPNIPKTQKYPRLK